MKNKTLKLISSIALVLVVAFCMTNTVFGFVEQNIVAVTSNTSSNVATAAGKILGIVQVVGMAVAVIMLTVLGIKYVSASPNEKADYKKGMTIYVIGAVFLFGASILVGVIKNFATGL